MKQYQQSILYTYRSIIKHYPQGLGNPHKQAGDTLLLRYNNPQLKSLYDYYYNLYSSKILYRLKANVAYSQYLHMHQVTYRRRLGSFITGNHYPVLQNDYELIESIYGKSLKQWIKDGLRRYTRTSVHVYIFYWGLGLICFIGSVIIMHYCKDYQRNQVLMEANRGFMLSYNPYLLKNNLEDYHVKIALLNDHLKNELKYAKYYSLTRQRKMV